MVRLVHARALSDAEFEAALVLQRRVESVRDPELEPMPAAELRILFADDASDFARHDRIVAFDDTPEPGESDPDADGPDLDPGGAGHKHLRALAIGHIELTNDPANASLAVIEVTPAPDAVTRAVVAELLQRAAAAGRTSVMVWDDHNDDRDRFWTALGAKLNYTEQESDLHVPHVDAALMDRWIEGAPTDLRLVAWAGQCPEEHIDALVAAVNAMNDAPTDDLDVADTIVDATMVRAEIDARAAMGLDYRGMLALTAVGEAAGLTEVLVNRYRPGASWQWNTVVLGPHRRRGVGRWLKAAMWLRLRRTEPEVTMLRTGNAASNAGMLAINTEMGFKPSHRMGVWQAPRERLEAALATAPD